MGSRIRQHTCHTPSLNSILPCRRQLPGDVLISGIPYPVELCLCFSCFGRFYDPIIKLNIPFLALVPQVIIDLIHLSLQDTLPAQRRHQPENLPGLQRLACFRALPVKGVSQQPFRCCVALNSCHAHQGQHSRLPISAHGVEIITQSLCNRCMISCRVVLRRVLLHPAYRPVDLGAIAVRSIGAVVV